MTTAVSTAAEQRRAQLAAAGLSRSAMLFAERVESEFPSGACDATQAELAARWCCTERTVRRLEVELANAGVWTITPARGRSFRTRYYPARTELRDRLEARLQALSDSTTRRPFGFVAGALAERAPVDNPSRTAAEASDAPQAGNRTVQATGHQCPPHRTPTSAAPDKAVRSTGPLSPQTPLTHPAAEERILSSRESARTHEAPRPTSLTLAPPPLVPPPLPPGVVVEPDPPGEPIRLTAEVLERELGLGPDGPRGLAGQALAQVGLAGEACVEVLTALVPGARSVHELRQRAVAAAALGASRANQTPGGLLRAGARDGWLLARVEGHAPTVRLTPLAVDRAGRPANAGRAVAGDRPEELARVQERIERDVRGDVEPHGRRRGSRRRRARRTSEPERATPRLPQGMSSASELFGAALQGLTGRRRRAYR